MTSPRNELNPHALSAGEVLSAFGTDARRGLTDAAVQQARARHGHNELAEEPPIPAWRKFLAQFKELVIIILMVAAVISGALGEWTDTLAILAIVLLNGLLGFVQEQRAERALAALQKLSAPQAKVIRNGIPQVLPARELVPGDRIELEAGDNVPADVRLLEAYGLKIQEATLTGESLPQQKDAHAAIATDADLGDRLNMAYMGTVVAAGKASAVAVATGMNTELGRIAGMLQRYEQEPTPLQKRLAELGKILALACLGIVALVFVIQLLRGGEFLEVFLLSVSLAVAAVPEGLPAVVTIALALGLQRMIRRNALIRRLPSVETLGSVTVICSDKTGTLTRNEMTVREIYSAGETYQVSGAGYAPHGQFLNHSKPIQARDEGDLKQTLMIGAHCNNSKLVPVGGGAEQWQIIGDPTEGALLVASLKAGIDPTDHGYHLLHEIPFDSERKAMSVVLKSPQSEIVMWGERTVTVYTTRSRPRVSG